MPDVPNQLVVRRVENLMYGERQLDHAKPRAEMSAGNGDGAYRLVSEFIGELRKIGIVHLTEVRRTVYFVQKGRISFHNLTFRISLFEPHGIAKAARI